MIKATIIQDSVSEADGRIITFELEYPRFIHAEFMTHRQFSRNCASSRAIPIAKMHEQIMLDMAMPVEWGKNQAGMQANELMSDREADAASAVWQEAGLESIRWSKSLANLGLHKQLANRVTEPFQVMKTVVTATEWENWFTLRNHPDAQPEIRELARRMFEALQKSQPMPLRHGQWHVPYVTRTMTEGQVFYTDAGGMPLDLNSAKIISASCCAQVSYRKSDDSLEKAEMIFDKLINSRPAHASPVEHQATPMVSVKATQFMPGVTHIDYKGYNWSGNFRGWIQHRQLIGA